jgi:hypothetical protein
MVVAMYFTKKVKTLINETLITFQSIYSNHNKFVYTTCQFANGLYSMIHKEGW